jgi:hypothetical protein
MYIIVQVIPVVFVPEFVELTPVEVLFPLTVCLVNTAWFFVVDISQSINYRSLFTGTITAREGVLT